MFWVYCSQIDETYHVVHTSEMYQINKDDFIEYDFQGPYSDYDTAFDQAMKENMIFGE